MTCRRSRLWPFVAVLGLVLLSGCQDPFYARCEGASDCPDDYTCFDRGLRGVCAPRCAADADCEHLRTSGETYCAAIGACVVACEHDLDCPPEAVCSMGACAAGARE